MYTTSHICPYVQIDTSVHRDKVNFVRLNMGPDGGIARLKTYGVVKPDLASIAGEGADGCCDQNSKYDSVAVQPQLHK